MFTIGIIVFTMLTTSPLASPVQAGSAEGRETLTRALQGAWLPLESGLAASAHEGMPLSAKYEIDDGAFQLSVYTWRMDASSADSFAEVIVDYSTGSVAEAVKDNVGYRAVSAMPSLDGGRPIAEVTLVRGDDWKTVNERLD
jgi:hypothetical protein